MGYLVAALLVAIATTSAAYHFWPIIVAAPHILTIAGLAFDVLGIVLMAVFYSPKIFRPDYMMFENQRPSVEWYIRQQWWLWWIGPAAIVYGFGLQIAANALEIFYP